MKITTKPCTMLVVDDLLHDRRLDPVRIITENFEPGKGRIILVCYDTAWVGYWGAMGGKTVEEFFMSCDAEYLAGNMGCSGHLRSGDRHRAYLVSVIEAAKEALRSRVPKMSKARAARIERIKHVNDLIKVIGSHGRRFFYNTMADRFARMEMDAKGKLWWVDDYQGTRVCIEKMGGYETRWQGFSHGGTLKSLVQDMRDYVKRDEALSLWKIAPECWGYGEEAAKATKKQASDLVCCIPF